MELNTRVVLPTTTIKLHNKSKVVFLGSCFSENIGRRYPSPNGEACVNPLGIAFNPHSVLNHFKGKTPASLFAEKDGKVVHHYYHSSLSAKSKDELTTLIEEQHELLLKSVKNADVLFVSYGSAWHYLHTESNKVVCNNHKASIKDFQKNIFSYTEIHALVLDTVKQALELNPDIELVFTVSPVKHLRDGLVNNSRSKANLISAIHDVCDANDRCYYFPSFEVLNDELRDYRFYSDDMAHPSGITENIIFQKFEDCFFTDKLKDKHIAYSKLRNIKEHRTNKMDSKQEKEWTKKIAKEEEKFMKAWG